MEVNDFGTCSNCFFKSNIFYSIDGASANTKKKHVEHIHIASVEHRMRQTNKANKNITSK